MIMQVTRAGEYGVLGVLHLARRGLGQVVMIDEVSREEQIPKSFLAKIFQNLARAGIVRSNRGTHGGFALAKDPETITTLEIIEAIEGRIVFQRCLRAPADCLHTGGCPLCGLFEQAQTQVREVFSQTTLSDLMKRGGRGAGVGLRTSAAALVEPPAARAEPDRQERI